MSRVVCKLLKMSFLPYRNIVGTLIIKSEDHDAGVTSEKNRTVAMTMTDGSFCSVLMKRMEHGLFGQRWKRLEIDPYFYRLPGLH